MCLKENGICFEFYQQSPHSNKEHICDWLLGTWYLLHSIPYLFVEVHVDLKFRIKRYHDSINKFQNERKIWPQIVSFLSPLNPHHMGRRIIYTIVTWVVLQHPLLVRQRYIDQGACVTIGLPRLVDMFIDDDNGLARPMTNGLVTNTTSHGMFMCSMWELSHVTPNITKCTCQPWSIAYLKHLGLYTCNK